MRRVGAVLTVMLCVLVVGFGYPVGGSIWSAGQVTGVAMVRGESQLELRDPAWVRRAAEEVILAARVDRFRRFIPGIPRGQCNPLDLSLETAKGWVGVELHCTSGLMFDDIDREAWTVAQTQP